MAFISNNYLDLLAQFPFLKTDDSNERQINSLSREDPPEYIKHWGESFKPLLDVKAEQGDKLLSVVFDIHELLPEHLKKLDVQSVWITKHLQKSCPKVLDRMIAHEPADKDIDSLIYAMFVLFLAEQLLHYKSSHAYQALCIENTLENVVKTLMEAVSTELLLRPLYELLGAEMTELAEQVLSEKKSVRPEMRLTKKMILIYTGISSHSYERIKKNGEVRYPKKTLKHAEARITNSMTDVSGVLMGKHLPDGAVDRYSSLDDLVSDITRETPELVDKEDDDLLQWERSDFDPDHIHKISQAKKEEVKGVLRGTLYDTSTEERPQRIQHWTEIGLIREHISIAPGSNRVPKREELHNPHFLRLTEISPASLQTLVSTMGRAKAAAKEFSIDGKIEFESLINEKIFEAVSLINEALTSEPPEKKEGHGDDFVEQILRLKRASELEASLSNAYGMLLNYGLSLHVVLACHLDVADPRQKKNWFYLMLGRSDIKHYLPVFWHRGSSLSLSSEVERVTDAMSLLWDMDLKALRRDFLLFDFEETKA